jgi:hypothetical protein
MRDGPSGLGGRIFIGGPMVEFALIEKLREKNRFGPVGRRIATPGEALEANRARA